MPECGANERFSIVALTRTKVMRPDIELQSVLRYRQDKSRCANGEATIGRLGLDRPDLTRPQCRKHAKNLRNEWPKIEKTL